jgi:very-short-patch-repair endonuclease
VAVEIDGGQWVAGGGRHNRDSDREKLNHAAADGWRVLRFSTQQVEKQPDACIELLRRTLQWRS